MMNQRSRLPTWIPLLAAAVIAGELGVLGLVLAGVLRGAERNLLPQALVAGAMALIVVALYVLRYHPEGLPASPAQAGVAFLAIFAFLLVGVYFFTMRALLSLPYDLASWSEPMFLVDIIKLRAGQPLYLPANDSNSNTYTFLAPVLSYWIARLFGQTASVPFYRLVQQFYLLLAAALAASASLDLFTLVSPKKARHGRGWWLAFFFPAMFLMATNNRTGVFNVYLHNDPLCLLVSTLAFWVLVKHASSSADDGPDCRAATCWFWLMVAIPALAFLAKQYLAIWAVAYVIHLWLDGRHPTRRIISFAAASFGSLALTVAACLAVWGQPFRYWVFQVMGGHVVSFAYIEARFGEAGWYIALGLGGALVLLRGEAFRRLLGIFAAWMVLLLGAVYTSGITYNPSHFGPSVMVAGCLFLAALACLWPEGEPTGAPALAQTWFQVGSCCLLVVAIFAGLDFTAGRPHHVTSDLFRYTRAIEQEFAGQPLDRILLDDGEWVYLQKSVLMKDCSPILATHRHEQFYAGFVNRIRQQAYARILTHLLPDGQVSYDNVDSKGIGKELLAHYREVRRIPRVEGMETWLYDTLTFSDVAVYEPIPAPSAQQAAQR